MKSHATIQVKGSLCETLRPKKNEIKENQRNIKKSPPKNEFNLILIGTLDAHTYYTQLTSQWPMVL